MNRQSQGGHAGQFKKSVTKQESRRKREEQAIQIRREAYEDQIQAKRRTNISVPQPVSAHMAERLKNLGPMVQAVMGDDPKMQLEATIAFRKLLSIEKHPPIEQVIQTGVVPRFMQFLTDTHHPKLQFEAAWAITNIASGNTDQTKVVVELGAVTIFIRLLDSEVEEVQEQAVWGIGNIAGDSPFHRDVVLRENALPKILDLLKRSTRLAMLRNGTWTLSNFCRGKPAPPWEVVRDCLPILARLIYITDEEVLADACWALSYLSDGRNEHIQAVIEAGVSRKMVELLMHTSFTVQTPALRTVGNIVTGDDIQTQIIINVGALPALLALLCSPKKSIRKEACWTISNITAGNKGQIQAVIENNLIPPLSQLLAKAEFDIKKEAAWAISNATSGGTPEQIRYLVSQGCIPPLCELLKASDPRVINVALEGIENILKAGQQEADDPRSQFYGRNSYVAMVERAGGSDNLEELEEHANRDIYERAVRIIETYLNGVEAGNEEDAGDTQPNDQRFDFTQGFTE